MQNGDRHTLEHFKGTRVKERKEWGVGGQTLMGHEDKVDRIVLSL